MAAHFLEAFDQQLEIALLVDRVEHGGINNEKRRGFVLEKETGVTLGDFFEISVGDLAFGINAALVDALGERRSRRLQINNQIGNGRRGRFHRRIDLLVQREFIFRQIEPGEKRIAFQQEIRNDVLVVFQVGVDISVFQRGELPETLEEKRELSRQRPALGVLVKTGEERILFGLLEHRLCCGQVFRQAVRQRSFACANRTFNNNVACLVEHRGNLAMP